MALPDYESFELGTPIIYGEAGATGLSLTVTKTMSLDALANGVARQGVSFDLGVNWNCDLLLQGLVEIGTAPAAGTTVEWYIAWSHDNVNWPSVITGADGAYALTGATVAQIKQTLGRPVHITVADGGTGTNRVVGQSPTVCRAQARYGAAVCVNLLGQAFRDEATATNNDSRFVITPIRRVIQDAAP
jgi:hypothetical protein